MPFIVYDLETSGLDPAWNVPLQAALIHVDDELRPLSELSLRCRLPAYIVPSPGALLTTGIRPDQLDQAPMSSLELLGQIGRALRAWLASPHYTSRAHVSALPTPALNVTIG